MGFGGRPGPCRTRTSSKLYNETWKVWFDDEGGDRDKRLTIRASPSSWWRPSQLLMKVNKSLPIILFIS